ncbi:hypothetical protein HMPREF0298_0654 [Corynebacterium lipophiloflavum DSM 44291]|uniref:Uncharacterized protein n=1 Tax=Corynebacterium lipophiloflavum (strain ATCC 700352 / DSM 44291 / CCUG 37336 / JCM 10383 / DMMZ 1944) TaxID=525263 RepID=C0XQD4_CORLD|nr:hypothetical protein HMPREF0298_0654 [Corynebacterium lipophiloflavum DSM 44291]
MDHMNVAARRSGMTKHSTMTMRARALAGRQSRMRAARERFITTVSSGDGAPPAEILEDTRDFLSDLFPPNDGQCFDRETKC